MRRIALAIAPATTTTCGDGKAFCHYLRARSLGTQWYCLIFGDLKEKDGWLQRSLECQQAEMDL